MIDNHRRPARRLLQAIGVGGATLAAVAAGALPAVATPLDHTVSVHVEGRFLSNADGSVRSTGDFLGTYELLSEQVATVWSLGDNTVKLIVGTDKMTGCLDLNHNKLCDRHGPRGSITMTYKRLATFDANGVFVESYCTHPITSVTNVGRHQDFTGGLILMADQARDGQGGNIKSTYRGEVVVTRG